MLLAKLCGPLKTSPWPITGPIKLKTAALPLCRQVTLPSHVSDVIQVKVGLSNKFSYKIKLIGGTE